MDKIQENQQYTTVSIEENVDMFSPRPRMCFEQEPKPDKEKEYLRTIRELIVKVDMCLDFGFTSTLNEILNKYARFVLLEEGHILHPIDQSNEKFMDFTGFMARKMRPKFGMNEPPVSNKVWTNKRFEHLEYVNINRTNEESGKD